MPYFFSQILEKREQTKLKNKSKNKKLVNRSKEPKELIVI